MGWMRRRRILPLVLLVAALSGCYKVPIRSQRSDEYSTVHYPYPFELTITRHGRFGGGSRTYNLTYDEIVILRTDPLARHETTESYSRSLTYEESERLKRFMAVFPIHQLHEEYVNRNVYDGLSSVFHFRFGIEEKRISVINTSVEPLSRLCKEVNRLVPPELAL
jgi:hypothetical protein